MMEMLRSWGNNPANPKNIQIPLMVFIGLEAFLNTISQETLTQDEKAAYVYLQKEIRCKKSRILNRQTYTKVIQAGSNEDNRKTALQNYFHTKQVNEV